MNETTLLTVMQHAVEDEPPSRVDPDRLVDTMLQRRKQRRAAFVSGGAVAAVTVGALAVAGPISNSGQPMTPAAPTPTVTGTPTNPEERLEKRSHEMEAYLAKRIPELVPGATNIDFEKWRPAVLPRPGDSLRGNALFTINGKRQSIVLSIDAPWGPRDYKPGGICWEIEDGGELKECERSTRPDGSKQAVVTMVSSPVTFVDHQRLDGTVVSVQASSAVVPIKHLIDLATDRNIGA